MLKGVYVLLPHSLFTKIDQVPDVAKVTALLIVYAICSEHDSLQYETLYLHEQAAPLSESNQTPDSLFA